MNSRFAQQHIQFVTGKLAEFSLRKTVSALATEFQFEYTITVLPITVAALMSTPWLARHLTRDPKASLVLIPGYCSGDLPPLAEGLGVPVERGPKDLRRLREFLGGQDERREDYGSWDIEILAEINHAPRFAIADLVAQAQRLAASGADLIDLGCEPGYTWLAIADAVKALKDSGLRVSVDSFEPREIAPAVRAGAELVLSVNASNRDAAADWGCEVVAIPDEIPTLGGLETTIEQLAARGVPLRIDPIVEPIGCGFAASLGRYLEVRKRFPDAEMMMGVGNLTELTDADSAGINVVLLGFCQEVGIHSVLTTQVIPWAQTSVHECDLARRLVHYAVRHRVPPKHVEPNLVILRDAKVATLTSDEIERLAHQIRDHNYRMFVNEEGLHLVSAKLHLCCRDPFELFDRLLDGAPANLNASHAFYLGYELAKAQTAMLLGKEYRQDEALDWGFLTVAEKSHRLSLKQPASGQSASGQSTLGPSSAGPSAAGPSK